VSSNQRGERLRVICKGIFDMIAAHI